MMKRIGEILLAVLILFTVSLYVFRLGGEHFGLIADAVAFIYSLLAVVLGFETVRIYQLKSKHGKSLFLIFLGIFMWFLAQLLWLLFSHKMVFLLETLRLTGYVPLTLGFFYILIISDDRFKSKRKYFLTLCGLFVVLSIIYLLLVPILQEERSVREIILTNGYLVVDFPLMLGVIILLFVSFLHKGGYLSWVWLIFSLAFLSVLIFDIYFALFTEQYHHGHYINILWLLNFILMAYAFYYNIRILEHLKTAALSFRKRSDIKN